MRLSIGTFNLNREVRKGCLEKNDKKILAQSNIIFSKRLQNSLLLAKWDVWEE